MHIDLQPKQLAEATGISPSHASNILGGKRAASSEIALAAFRAFGVRLGLLAEMTDEDIARLNAQAGEPAECHGGDAVAGSFDHADTDSAAAAVVSAGKDDDVTASASSAGQGFEWPLREAHDERERAA